MKKRPGLIPLLILLATVTVMACSADSVNLSANSTMHLSSPDLPAGQLIPPQFACGGADVSPTLYWTKPPAGTRSQLLMLSDPDAPGGTFTHWIVYNLPATTTALTPHMAQTAQLPDGSMQAVNDANTIGYFGPCPPRHSTHRYFFRVYALDARLPLAPGSAKSLVLEAMRGHVLAKGKLMARYHR